MQVEQPAVNYAKNAMRLSLLVPGRFFHLSLRATLSFVPGQQELPQTQSLASNHLDPTRKCAQVAGGALRVPVKPQT